MSDPIARDKTTGAPPDALPASFTAFDDTGWHDWRVTADSNMAAARREADAGAHHVACMLAEQAAQCALKALLRGVGATTQARGHDLVLLAAACAADTGMPLTDQHEAALQRLAQIYLPSRYPDALPGGSPPERFGKGQSQQAIEDAQAVLGLTQEAWDRLRAEVEHMRPDPSDEPSGGGVQP